MTLYSCFFFSFCHIRQKLLGSSIVLGIMNKSLMITKQTVANISQNAFVLFRVEDIEDSLYVLWMPPTKHHVLQFYHNLPIYQYVIQCLCFHNSKEYPLYNIFKKNNKDVHSVQMSILIIFGKIARSIALKYILNTMISFKKPPLFLL